MTVLKRLLSLAVVLGGTTLVTAAVPEGSFHCENCVVVGSQHGFTGVDCVGEDWGPDGGCGDCHEFNACHENMQSGNGSSSHYVCSGSFAIVDELNKAVIDGKTEAVARIVADSDKVKYDVTRGLLLVAGCRNELIARFEVPRNMLAALD